MAKLNIMALEGLVKYDIGLALQETLSEKVKGSKDLDYLLLLRHKPVITKGKFGKQKNLLLPKQALKEKGIELYEINRGGDFTYHGPGQLMGYPIIDLERKKIHNYKHKLCESIIELLKDYGIKSIEGHDKFSGVWVNDQKIAAIGFSVNTYKSGREIKRITQHGFALYVLDEMENFSLINPCGMPNLKMTNMQKILGKEIDFKELKKRYIQHFRRVFKYDL